MTATAQVEERLEDQIRWYDEQAGASKRWYRRMKVTTLVSTAAVPLVAVFGLDARVTATLGAIALIAEGVQQLNQYHANWIGYRSTAEALKHERGLYRAGAAPYADVDTAHVVLAERIEAMVSQEHSNWVTSQELPKGGH